MSCRLIFVLLLSLGASSCFNNSDDPMLTDNFDRAEMLEYWASDIIIPAYLEYTASLEKLQSSVSQFNETANVDALNDIRSSWLEAYKSWQEVAMFAIGKAEEIDLLSYTNIYPANTELIQEHISNNNYNLELPSNYAAQGFPALGYLLYGSKDSDESIVDFLVEDNTRNYVEALVNRLTDLAILVNDDWNTDFKQQFIANSGSSATASTDALVNDFLFYYEKHLRAGKVGIPAGIFSGTSNQDLVEGAYSEIYSKELFEAGFIALQKFFSGISYDALSEGPSLKQYLTEIHESNDTELDIADSVLSQWDAVEQALETVDNNFKQQIGEDNTKMLAVYDELQKAVVLLKVDMLSALNIQVDFVDADGD